MSLTTRVGSSKSAMLFTGACWTLLALIPAGIAQGDEPATAAPIPPTPTLEAAPAATPALAAELRKDRPLSALKASVKPTEGDLPTNHAAPLMAQFETIHSGFGENRPWMLSSYEWESPATRHLPLFFEEPNLERLGYTHGFAFNVCGYESGSHMAECLQPVVSGLHFFGRIPAIPYMWGYQCPCEPVYTLGMERPGSPVCYRKYRIPLSLQGALYEAGAVVGLVFLIP